MICVLAVREALGKLGAGGTVKDGEREKTYRVIVYILQCY